MPSELDKFASENAWKLAWESVNGPLGSSMGVNVNDFGAVADGLSHPLSETYGTLGAAQVDYPAAIALSDEKDWCAWQAATNYIYTRDDTHPTANWSSGRIVAHGQYVVNRTTVFNHAAITIEGTTPGPYISWKSATTITYNGAVGTIDAPTSIFDFYLRDEFLDPPPGRKGNGALSGGTQVEIRNILFVGKEGSMFGSFDVSGFISGIRIRKSSFTKISNCRFGGCLYDGITITDTQLFLKIFDCYFYGCHRDAIGVQAYADDFSTTIWIYNNEFGSVGRYAIMLDCTGSIEPFPIVRDNSFEHLYSSYFVQNPEWFVQGLVAGCCFIACGNLLFDGNRYEAVTDTVAGCWADIHLVSGGSPVIQNSAFRNLAVTGMQAVRRTTAGAAYLAATKHFDITNERNYHVGTQADCPEECQSLTVRKILNLSKLIVVDGKGISSSVSHLMEEASVVLLSIPTAAGAYATIAQPRTSAIVTVIESPNWSFKACGIADLQGYRVYGSFNQKTGNGDYIVRSGPAVFGQWAANTAYVKTMTGNEMASLRAPITENGFYYQCIVSGTSHATTEPTWPTTIGNTVVDGTVTWKCVGRCAYVAEDVATEWQVAGQRNRKQASSPTIGLWAEGDQVWFPSPAAAGYRGKVCTTAGVPGTWKGFGLIES